MFTLHVFGSEFTMIAMLLAKFVYGNVRIEAINLGNVDRIELLVGNSLVDKNHSCKVLFFFWLHNVES